MEIQLLVISDLVLVCYLKDVNTINTLGDG